MSRFYEPDLTVDLNSPFVRDASNKLVRRGYWMDMDDRSLIMVMTKGIGARSARVLRGGMPVDAKGLGNGIRFLAPGSPAGLSVGEFQPPASACQF